MPIQDADGVDVMVERFLTMVHDPALREVLLERLARSGLLSAFLATENGTN